MKPGDMWIVFALVGLYAIYALSQLGIILLEALINAWERWRR